MNGRSGTFSPVSTDGSEWSGISRYQNNESSFSPSLSTPRGNLATPPVSTSSNGLHGPIFNGMDHRRPSNGGNPSPPNSIAGRSSYAISLTDEGRRKTMMMEENLAQHYAILKRYLAQSLRDEKGNPKPNRARDKLLRLSPVQFQELSTDVYDELLRRQSAGGPQTHGPGQVPTFLLPKENFHPKRNQARQKLATLPPPRFRDLATDVFYELERRFPRFTGGEIDRTGSPALSMIGPPSRQGTPNGIRPGSRGTGPMRPPPGPGGGFGPRKASLGGQVPSGLPQPAATVPDDGFGRPTAKTFQSNTIIPNKSTMVEDDDDQTGPEDNEDRRSEAFGVKRDANSTPRNLGEIQDHRKPIAEFERRIAELQEKVSKLEVAVHDKDLVMERLHETNQTKENAFAVERQEWIELRPNLEQKLRDALNLNGNLHSELEKVRANHADSERKLRAQASQLARQEEGEDSSWKGRYERLDKAHQELQVELKQQRTITNEVKQEAITFLGEMKEISANNSQSLEREVKLVYQVQRLEDQVKEWRSRYARTKTQLRSLRSSSQGLSLPPPDTAQTASFAAQDGLIKDVHVTKFQVAVDELLRIARGNEPEAILDHVRSVVIAVRNISLDSGNPTSDDDANAALKNRLKSTMFATANNLITASRNFVLSKGISPVSLLDAAASHLTLAVVALLRMDKIRPTSEAELDEDDDNSLIAESPAYYGMPFGSEKGDSTHSSISSPQQRFPLRLGESTSLVLDQKPQPHENPPNGAVNSPVQNTGLALRVQENEIEELKTFFEDQTERLAQSIQSLVSSVRAEDSPATIQDYLGKISVIVGKVVSETQRATLGPNNTALVDRADPIIRSLGECRTRLMEARVQGGAISEAAEWKDFTKRLPPLAFEVARQTKELAERLGHPDSDDDKSDDFRL